MHTEGQGVLYLGLCNDTQYMLECLLPALPTIRKPLCTRTVCLIYTLKSFGVSPFREDSLFFSSVVV